MSQIHCLPATLRTNSLANFENYFIFLPQRLRDTKSRLRDTKKLKQNNRIQKIKADCQSCIRCITQATTIQRKFNKLPQKRPWMARVICQKTKPSEPPKQQRRFFPTNTTERPSPLHASPPLAPAKYREDQKSVFVLGRFIALNLNWSQARKLIISLTTPYRREAFDPLLRHAQRCNNCSGPKICIRSSHMLHEPNQLPSCDASDEQPGQFWKLIHIRTDCKIQRT